jgi:hypothetical protein
MRRPFFLFTAIAVFVSGASGATSDQQLAPVTALVEETIEEQGLPGAVLAIFRGDETLYERAWGEFEIDSVIQTASSAKWITATVMMRLADDGLIALDDRIVDFDFELKELVAGILDGTGSQEAAAQAGRASMLDDRVVRVSPADRQYIDPEIWSEGDKATFQDREGNIWVADLDPKTGRFVTETGKDYLMDTGAYSLRETANGPEFGVDRDGWAIYYTKGFNGVPQIWRAVWSDRRGVAAPLTRGPKRHQTAITRHQPTDRSVQLMCIEGTWSDGWSVWLDDDRPEEIHPIAPLRFAESHPRFVPGGRDVVLSIETGGVGQLYRVSAATDTKRQITNDDGDKTHPFFWSAPEYGGATLMLAIVDHSSIAIYRDTGGEYWERISTLTKPAETEQYYMQSAEPFVAGGKSYMSLTIGNPRTERPRTMEVWVFGIDDDPATRFARRVDDLEGVAHRSDPESYVGSDDVFIVYNYITPQGVYEIHRARTGLKP